MTKEEQNKLSQEIEDISNNFELKPFSDNVKLLKEDFDINKIKSPKQYLETIDEITEVLRQTRLLFLYSVFNKVCIEEDKLYYFDTPYQAAMSYSAIIKKGESFYLLDEDGDYSQTFTSEPFVQFIDDQYWELYE
ncbi:hypothetical protein B0A79_01970 [Flavobacterium piscis]|uniref:SMI1/KNR4 family protein n=1 Tax=Flavobacterium piscis TaxID=1114874 RepID=A0ABX2XN35_9FLAO|nr:hypothetical protein [Flavobacterium piscis]OCB77155.1 hypothetical protein FLP_04225 [Flavobacterium piscis]OXG07798.1 hypothetical protein B0A79_01970 [Flavobacterium piscis]